MMYYRFYEVQCIIDNLKNSKKRAPKILKEIVVIPQAKDFLITNKLNLLELINFHDIVNLKVTKKMIIDSLECYKLSIIRMEYRFKLPVIYLQKISDFIENYKDRLNDNEYKTDLEYLARFY